MNNGTSPDRIPSVTLTPANIALLVTAIAGLVSIAVYIRTLNDKADTAILLQRENRALIERILEHQQRAESLLDWHLRSTPQVAPRSAP